MEVTVELGDVFPFKLRAIVDNDSMWHSKPRDNIFLKEFLHISLCNPCNSFCFHSFGEIFTCHYDELLLCFG